MTGTDTSDVNNNTQYGMASSSAWQDFDDKLINAVQRFRVVYGVTLKEFHNNTLNENAWQSNRSQLRWFVGVVLV